MRQMRSARALSRWTSRCPTGLLGVQDARAERRQQPGVKIADLLIAAAAEIAGLVVLHYDHDFERIADITGQATEWIITAGTLP
jgi:predicted nucleic acid-binding protein